MSSKLKVLILSLSTLLLAACHTDAVTNQQVLRGKNNFESGYYREAYQQLLPPAVEGNMEAQYAIGYMYFNGYGVTRDTETGTFWIKKSADQHYAPAVQALKTMNQQ